MALKTKEISLDMRKHITELRKEGKYFREIGKILKLSFTTVGYIVKKYLETGSVENKPRSGGPRTLTSRAKRMICAQTVRNVLHSAGLKARSPRKKPYISEVDALSSSRDVEGDYELVSEIKRSDNESTTVSKSSSSSQSFEMVRGGRGSLVVKVSNRGWYVTSSSPVPLKTRRVRERCTLNLSRSQMSSRWWGVIVRRGDASSGVVLVT
ncbi:paired domain-containing protein [Trichonephila clavipes]|nr:paired domain-containing protein [Trichonephila clavipes]